MSTFEVGTAFGRGDCMTREIDCCIVGSGIGSLACGTVLAQRGWQVLLLTVRPLEDSFSCVQDGVEHDRSPELFWGFEKNGFLRQLLAAQESDPALVRRQPGLQVVLLRHRLGFYGLGCNWDRELRREFPSSWRAILRCSEQLCSLSEVMRGQMEAPLWGITSWGRTRFIGRRPFRAFLEDFGLPPPFCGIAEAATAACFHVEPWETTVGMAAATFGHIQRGLFAPRDGAKALVEELVSRFQGLGGQIRVGAVREVKRKWGAVREVVMTEGEVVSCRFVVVEPEPNPGDRTLHVQVDEALIPGEMGQNVLVVEADPKEATPAALLHLALGRISTLHDPLRRERSVAIRILRASPQDPMSLLEETFPGWAKARVCSGPPKRQQAEHVLFSRRWPGRRNVLVISGEGPLGRGLSAAAWDGYQVATRLMSRT